MNLKEVAKEKIERITQTLDNVKPKKSPRRLSTDNIWLVLIIVLLMGWVLTWALSNWASPRLNTMATVATAIGIAGLCVLMYVFVKYMKQLAEATKSQTDASKIEVEILMEQAKASIDMAERTGETTQYYQEQLKRMLRPMLVLDLAKEKTSRWEKWEGTFKIRNIGNGPALQPVIRVRTQVVTHIKMEKEEQVFEKSLLFMGSRDEPYEMVIPLKIPVSVRSIVTQRPVSLSYMLEIYWKSMYEDGYAKSVIPLHLGLDRSGDARLRMEKLDVEWNAMFEKTIDGS